MDTKPHGLIHGKSAVHLLIIAVLGAAVYSGAFTSPFQFDDYGYVLGEPRIQSLRSFLDFSGTRYVGFLSFAVNYALWGYSPAAFHAVNVSIHIFNALLLYLLVALTFTAPLIKKWPGIDGKEGSLNIAFAASLIFLVHPVQTEAVTYVAQRFASLASFFYLLSLVFYAKARLRTYRVQSQSQGRGGTAALYLASVGLAVMAQKTKEISFTLPVVMALYEFTFFDSKKGVGARLLYLAPFFLTMLIIPLELFGPEAGILHKASSVSNSVREAQLKDLETVNGHDYLVTQFRVIVTYLRLLVFPYNQKVIYDYPVYKSFFVPQVVASFAFLCAVFASAVYLLFKSRRSGGAAGLLISFFILYFFITLSVESSVIPIADVIFEHRLYLPSAGFAAALSTLIFLAAGKIAERPGRERLARLSSYATAALIVAVFSVLTYQRNKVWADELTFWQDAVNKAPDKISPEYNINYNLGVIYQKRGAQDKAITYYKKALAQDPRNIKALGNIASAYGTIGDSDAAIARYNEALAIAPSREDFHYGLAMAHYRRGDARSAMEHLREALKLNPADETAHYNLGLIHEKERMYGPAAAEFGAALSINPNDTEAADALARVRSR